MCNTKYQEIRMQSIVFVTLRIPNKKTEVRLTKKQNPLEQDTRYWFEIHLSVLKAKTQYTGGGGGGLKK